MQVYAERWREDLRLDAAAVIEAAWGVITPIAPMRGERGALRKQNMQFGIIFPTKIDDWQVIADAKAMGYHRAWAPDSQMIWSDCYATLALAAVNTTRIQLGTGVSFPRTRIAPVTAHSIASVHRLAPARATSGRACAVARDGRYVARAAPARR